MTAMLSTLEKNPDLRYSVEATGGAAHQVTGRRGSRHESCGRGPNAGT